MKKAFWIVVAVLIVSIGANVWLWRSQPEPSVVIEHDTVWKDTTIIKPVPTESKETGETIYIKVPPSDTIKQKEPSPLFDSATIALPVEQKRYDDSLYTAWVSGFRPQLDSLRLHLPEVQTTVTKTIVRPAPLITFGIQVGGGVGIFSRQPDIYLGIGGQLNLFRK